MRKVLILYLPVLHSGYVDFVLRHMPHIVFVLGESDLRLLDYLSRDARALQPLLAAQTLKHLLSLDQKCKDISVEVVDNGLRGHLRDDDSIIMSDEDITRAFAEEYLTGCDIEWDTGFIRWNMQNVTKEFPIDPDEEVSVSYFDRDVLSFAKKQSGKSPDWWRQVGAVVVKDHKLLLCGYNNHYPNEYASYFEGDPRTSFKPGERIDISLAQHAEAWVIGTAAGAGIALSGSNIYVTTFPCPTCARLIVAAGIKKVFYTSGYSLVNAREVFRENGVKVVRVN